MSNENISLDQQVPAWLKEFNVTSVSVAYIDGGKIAFTAYYGDQVPGWPPANESTLYNVASLTKPVTAEVVLRLASEQKLSLDEPMSRFWTDPDIKDNPWTKLLTPRIWLSHQTGFTKPALSAKAFSPFSGNRARKQVIPAKGSITLLALRKRKPANAGKSWHSNTFLTKSARISLHILRATGGPAKAKPVEAADRTKWSAADLLRTTVTDYAKFIISVMGTEHVTPEIARQRLSIVSNKAASCRRPPAGARES
jgi:hypothetical protein